MKLTRPRALKILGIAFVVIVLGVLFYWKAVQNYQHQDYPNSNFFFFWLSGRMVWTGENPYNSTQWLAAHDAFGATWKPNRIFPYPLPLMFFMAPLGLLPLGQAYIVWQMVSEIVLAITCWLLLSHWRERAQRWLFLPLTISLLFFGPVYLSLQIGSVGALALAAILVAILLLERDRPLLAGIALALTMLKPPQGLTLLVLAGFWFLARCNWKAILGISIGGLALLVIGLLRDPLWLTKFRGASQIVLDRTLGIQSNVYSFAYLSCKQAVSCMWTVGTTGTLLVLGLAAFYLWRNRDQLTAWEAFNIIIPVGFVTALYLWSYDQLPYVIPITWIVGRLIEKTRSYLYAFLLLIVVDVLSFVALVVQAGTRRDILSIFTTLVVLGMLLFLGSRPRTARVVQAAAP